MSVLLVACPCVIGLATPIIVWSALGRLAERGLIVRTGDAVERLAEVDRVMLDKTGTLTEDSFALARHRDDRGAATSGRGCSAGCRWCRSRAATRWRRPFAKLPRPFAGGGTARRDAAGGARVAAWRRRSKSANAHGIPVRHRHAGVDRIIQSRSRRERALAPGNSRPPATASTSPLDGELVAVAVLAERLRDSAPRDARGRSRGSGCRSRC